MRHGQTLFNKRGLVQGHCDSPLTELGRRQPLYAKRWFEERNIKFDHAYASTQERASDTLELIVDMPYERLKAIKEMSFGIFEGESEHLARACGDLQTSHDAFVPFGGDDMKDVQVRMVDALTEAMEIDDHHTVLAISHGCAAFAFTHKWLPDLTWEKIEFTNCCILRFEYENGVFTFIEAVSHDFEQPL